VMATTLCSAVWDWQRRDQLLERAAQITRSDGALSELEMILYAQSMADTTLGDLAGAERRLSEGEQLRATIGGLADDVTTLYRHPELVAWTGADPDLAATTAMVIGASELLGNGAMATLARGALALDHLARCRYDDACVAATLAVQGDPIGVNTWVAPMLVEAAIRAGDEELARSTAYDLSHRAEAAANSWSLGVLARVRGLVDCSAEAEHAYRRSISLLSATPARADLARSHLVYANGFGVASADPTPATTCASRTRCSSRWARRRSPNVPDRSSRRPASGRERARRTPCECSRRRRITSRVSPRRG
jgi:hypothetical protein